MLGEIEGELCYVFEECGVVFGECLLWRYWFCGCVLILECIVVECILECFVGVCVFFWKFVGLI